MPTTGIREARQNLSALLERVKLGEEITITDRGEPVAVLSAPKQAARRGLADIIAFRNALNIDPISTELIIKVIDEDCDGCY